MLTAHFFSDVLVGASIGLVVARETFLLGFPQLAPGLVLTSLRSVRIKIACHPGIAKQEPGPTKPLSRGGSRIAAIAASGMTMIYSAPGLEEILEQPACRFGVAGTFDDRAMMARGLGEETRSVLDGAALGVRGRIKLAAPPAPNSWRRRTWRRVPNSHTGWSRQPFMPSSPRPPAAPPSRHGPWDQCVATMRFPSLASTAPSVRNQHRADGTSPLEPAAWPCAKARRIKSSSCSFIARTIAQAMGKNLRKRLNEDRAEPSAKVIAARRHLVRAGRRETDRRWPRRARRPKRSRAPR